MSRKEQAYHAADGGYTGAINFGDLSPGIVIELLTTRV